MQALPKEDKSLENPANTVKIPSAFGCVTDYNPQQQEFIFDELTLDSCFDSGNMANATKEYDGHYSIWISPDCAGTSNETYHRVWFHFRVRLAQQTSRREFTFTIKNTNSQIKLYTEGLLPVYKTLPSSPQWKRIKPQRLLTENSDKGFDITFSHTIDPSDQETFFAFTYPWSYSEDQAMLDKYEQELKDDQEIYFNRELLVYSREQRRVELLTISSHSNKLTEREKALSDLFPEQTKKPRAFTFSKKKYVFISSRVHPGETPASYAFKSLLKFLVSKTDIRAKALRENFVMVLVPMLNPDGVYRGHYRTDTLGQNLNRYYTDPDINEHPSIYAVKEIVLELNRSNRLFLYCDLHAHAGKKGCFVYGNNMNFKEQVESRMFPKLLSLNSQFFEYDSSSFSEKNTQLVDKNDGEDKEGAGRVALYKATNLIYCYTLECNYNSGRYRNTLLPLVEKVIDNNKDKERGRRPREEEKDSISNNFSTKNSSPERTLSFECYNENVFEEIGEAIGPTLLDMIEANPLSRVPNLPYRTCKVVNKY